jgi:hypothetical protein
MTANDLRIALALAAIGALALTPPRPAPLIRLAKECR